ncbi:MAG: hypothetical protein NVS1B4_00010 [Gemmatimonadaceae bacterium]
MQRVDATTDGAPAVDTTRTGFPSLDKMLGGGLRVGDLVVLGGDVASGKSALSLAMALRAAEGGATTMFMTNESSPDRVAERMLAIQGRARIEDLRQGTLDELTRAGVGAAAVRLRGAAPLVERIGPSTDGVSERMRAVPDLKLAVIDSLEGLAPGERNRDEELAALVGQLKALAVERRVSLLVTAHLPLLSRDRADLRPRLDDFGALGAVKQQADVVLGLFREEMYSRARGIEGATELAICKHRDGGIGYVDLYFYAQWMRFEDMLDPDR